MKKTSKPNPLKVFNDNKAMAYKKAGGAMNAYKKSLKKAQDGMSFNNTYQGPLTESDIKRLDRGFPSTATQIPYASKRPNMGYGTEDQYRKMEKEDRSAFENYLRSPAVGVNNKRLGTGLNKEGIWNQKYNRNAQLIEMNTMNNIDWNSEEGKHRKKILDRDYNESFKKGGSKKPLTKAQKGISMNPNGMRNVDTVNKLMVDKENISNSKSNKRAKAQMDLLDKREILNQDRKKNIEQARKLKKGPALKNYGIPPKSSITDPEKQYYEMRNSQGAKKGGAVKKKMAVGGSSDSDCWPGKPGCGAEKARRVNKRRRFWNSDAGKTVKKVGAGVAAAGAGAAAYAKNVFKVKDAIKGLSEQKKGGSVKRKK